MHDPTARPELSRRASLAEAATSTAPQWMCCAASVAAGWHPAVAWQVAVYQVARQHAVESVRAARLRAEWARWN